MALLMPPHGTADTTSWHHLAPLGTSHNITWCPKVPRKIVYFVFLLQSVPKVLQLIFVLVLNWSIYRPQVLDI